MHTGDMTTSTNLTSTRNVVADMTRGAGRTDIDNAADQQGAGWAPRSATRQRGGMTAHAQAQVIDVATAGTESLTVAEVLDRVALAIQERAWSGGLDPMTATLGAEAVGVLAVAGRLAVR